MFGIDINPEIILKEPIRLWVAFWILCGFYMLNYLSDMIWSEIQYNGGGDDFIRYGKKYVKNKCSTRNKGIKK